MVDSANVEILLFIAANDVSMTSHL